MENKTHGQVLMDLIENKILPMVEVNIVLHNRYKNEYDLYNKLLDIAHNEGIRVKRGRNCKGMEGSLRWNVKTGAVWIVINKVSARVMIHEMAHFVCDHHKLDSRGKRPLTRAQREVIVETIVAMVFKRIYNEPKKESIEYIYDWAHSIKRKPKFNEMIDQIQNGYNRLMRMINEE